MGYRVLADATTAVHFGFLAYVIAGGFLAWRWLRAIWPHLPLAGWGLITVVFHLECPLTRMEDWARRRAGEPGLTTGFIDHYLAGVVFPERYAGLVGLLAAIAVGVSWIGASIRWRSCGRPPASQAHATLASAAIAVARHRIRTVGTREAARVVQAGHPPVGPQRLPRLAYDCQHDPRRPKSRPARPCGCGGDRGKTDTSMSRVFGSLSEPLLSAAARDRPAPPHRTCPSKRVRPTSPSLARKADGGQTGRHGFRTLVEATCRRVRLPIHWPTGSPDGGRRSRSSRICPSPAGA
jgi:hypothetical protein